MREQSFEVRLQDVLPQSCLKFGHSQGLCQILKQNFNEDTTTRCSLFFIQVDHGKDVPPDSISTDQMAKESCDVAQSICFISMNRIVVFRK